MDSLMNGAQSGKTFLFLYLMIALGAVVLLYTFVFNKTKFIRYGLPDLFLIIWCLYSVLNSALKHVPLSLRLFELFGLAILYLALRQIRRKYLIWLFVAVILGGAIQAVCGNLQLWGYYPSHHGLFKMTGNFFNPGPYAGYLAAVFPIALGLYLNKSLNVRVSEPSIVRMFEGWNVRMFGSFKREASNNQTFQPSNILNSAASNNQTHLWQSIIRLIAIATIISILLVLPASRSRAAWLAVALSSFYLLAKLFNETGQHEKAVATAKELLDKAVKIESTAVQEIQEEMKKIIEKTEAEI